MDDEKGWDSYWKSRQHEQALTVRTGVSDPLEQHWHAVFDEYLPSYISPQLLELACGNGTLISMLSPNALASMNAVGLDISFHGIANLIQRQPQCQGVVASADALPFKPQSFELVVSQFGVEYAGSEALIQALSMLKNNGVMAALVHFQGSDIVKASAHACAHLRQLAQQHILSESKKALQAALSLANAQISEVEFREADKAFSPVVKALESIIRACKHQDLGNKLKRLHGDIARIYQRPERFNEKEVMQWLDTLTDDFVAYHKRMKALVDAALSPNQLRELEQRIGAAGCTVIRYQPLVMEQFSFGWELVCQRVGKQ
ncbi:class I SAM-dependent methyltransferase [Lacimicrobium sp. SS2-24]|uniref:class I SAM-dependent methyltransferase n=1 Tax=Lacimicrobium sp. SS2-24 TaxID=2005569 RepID=UPI000B4AEB2B|nr:class I SAM-dependent methyltransferase [Lacimicrobium sp. SS2-24]